MDAEAASRSTLWLPGLVVHVPGGRRMSSQTAHAIVSLRDASMVRDESQPLHSPGRYIYCISKHSAALDPHSRFSLFVLGGARERPQDRTARFATANPGIGPAVNSTGADLRLCTC